MSTKNQNAAANEAAAENQLTTIESTFNALANFEAQDTSNLIELTSELLKLEAGESFNGIMSNEIELMDSQDEGAEPFPCAVLYAKNKSKVLCADAVVVSTQKKLFAGIEGQAYKVVRMECRGMRKSASNSKNEYRDIKIYTM
jgi:hypothetical protein